MILLLDNYDSFVHNLARYFRRLGCQTQVIRSDEIDRVGCESLAPDAVVISPGPRRPADAGCSVEVIRDLSPKIPILGVCLGHQAIAVALGGSIYPCGPVHGMASRITHLGRGLFQSCPSPLSVGRYHSLAINEDDLPEQLEVTARDDDGVIMAVRHRQRPLFGVQFHPESVLSEDGLLVLRNFITMTRESARSTPTGGKVAS